MTEKNERPAAITIYSYQKVWNYEKMLYQITDNINLPAPVIETDGKYFISCLVVVLACQFVFRFPTPNPFVWMFFYIGIPLGGTAILRYKSFDGKNPMTFIRDYFWYLGDKGKESEFFSVVTEEPTHIADWQLGYRHRLRMQPPEPERRKKSLERDGHTVPHYIF